MTKTSSVTTGVEETRSSTRTQNLALLLQEVITGVVRLRANRQEIADAEAFRVQVRNALKAAAQNARSADYSDADVRLATYAVVAFLDESVLNTRKPIFRDWVRRPLQEEMFGRHVAGETFFEYLDEVLGRRDSTETADLLEVYSLCLLLGFQGRYSVLSKAELRGLIDRIEDKIRRIRNQTDEISPAWRTPPGGAAFSSDAWTRRMAWATAGLCALCLILFIAYEISLRGGAQSLRALAGGGS